MSHRRARRGNTRGTPLITHSLYSLLLELTQLGLSSFLQSSRCLLPGHCNALRQFINTGTTHYILHTFPLPQAIPAAPATIRVPVPPASVHQHWAGTVRGAALLSKRWGLPQQVWPLGLITFWVSTQPCLLLMFYLEAKWKFASNLQERSADTDHPA